jgi:HopA1 effector protein family/Lanthionine synthetase C-like protein
VRKNGLTLRARPRDCITAADQILTPGLSVSLELPGRLPHSSPGFYTVMCARSTSQHTTNRLLRLYWNVGAEAAPAFVRELTELLNTAGVSFRLKIVNDPARFVRCDAAVLYMDAAEYSRFVPTLAEAYAHLASMLKPMTPVFAKRLAPGLALAEDPGAGASFGLHRCRLVAEGILCAHERRVRKVDDRVQAVADRFTQEGLSLDRPYLNAGSPDDYAFVCSEVGWTVSRAGEQRNPFGSEEWPDGQFIKTAGGIAARLAHQSIWYREQCNWIGSGPAPLQPSLSSRTPIGITSSLGPDLYAGTSGVALYLAEFFRITSDRTAARLALGAIRHALANVESVSPAMSPGLYTGWTGIALAAARVGHVLGNEQLLRDAAKLVGRIPLHSLPKESDLLSGSAGAVIGLLLLRQALGDPNGRLLPAAIRFATT